MELQKRLDYGFNGYQVPPTPRAARSARRRSLVKRKANDHQMCAFDLLATVAGKVLLDGESSASSANACCGKEHPAIVEDSAVKYEKCEDKPLREKSWDRDCYERNFMFTELIREATVPNSCPKEPQNGMISLPSSGITSSECSEKIGSGEQLVNDNCNLHLGISSSSVDIDLSGFRPSPNCGSEDESRKDVKMESPDNRNLSVSNKASDRKSSAIVCSVDSIKFPFCKDCTPCGSFPVSQENVKSVTRDDDDNDNSECIEPKKMLTSKPCKKDSNLKDDELYNAERCNYLNSKNGFKRQRSLRDYPFKKRKLYDYSWVSNSDESINGDRICRVPGSCINGDGLRSSPTLPRANPTSASVTSGYASFHPRNSQVKLKIKSFRVPELFIEIPETATVGSLKRTVLEAVNAVLGGGLRVGVLVQGKKIRDDNKTLLQTGISHDNKMDTLGFTLEPSPAVKPIRWYHEDRPAPLLCDNPQPLARCPPTPTVTQNTRQQVNQDALPDLPSMPLQRTTSESKAIISVPSTKQDALAIVPLQKSKRSDCPQRRIRRPFAVAEVEALVQAVEKLGTGRWRDVKLRAFDGAKHRTYVDLKDKWKTLVHTARISPQQRRGEPVPQELLDRVLTAHAYWSQQQARQHLKSQPDTCLLL